MAKVTGEIAMREFIFFVDWLISLFIFILVAHWILQLLISFGVVNRYNQVVYTLNDIFYRLTEPFLAPIRRRIGLFNGVDLSPMVLLIILYFIRIVILPNIAKAF
ncbi:MAG: YggT family protein [Hyphomicrobiales bacterium]|nr:YggT family protein [Hyphomicrobiales bacterium]